MNWKKVAKHYRAELKRERTKRRWYAYLLAKLSQDYTGRADALDGMWELDSNAKN
jgi:hypothetical protein